MRRRHGSEYAARSHAGATVAIIATTAGSELILVEQRRPALKRRVLELPTTWVPSEHPLSDTELLSAARRSLSLVSGYLATSWRKLMVGPVAAGLSDELVTFFRARDLERAGRTPSMQEIDPDTAVHYVTRGSFEGFLTLRRSEDVLVDPLLYAAAWLAWGDEA